MPPSPFLTSTLSLKDYTIFGVRVFIGFIFVLSGAFQFLDFSFLSPSALQLEIFPGTWLKHGTMYFGIGELLIGIWLILGVWIKPISIMMGGVLIVSLGSNLPILFGNIEYGYQPPSFFILTDVILLFVLLILILSQRHRLTIGEIFKQGE